MRSVLGCIGNTAKSATPAHVVNHFVIELISSEKGHTAPQRHWRYDLSRDRSLPLSSMFHKLQKELFLYELIILL